MFSPADTIVATATPPGRGGIGVVRVSGPRAQEIAGRILTAREPLAARTATFTHVVMPRDDAGIRRGPAGSAPNGEEAGFACDRKGACSASDGTESSGSSEEARPLDQVVATFFPAPASYTGEDVLEVSAHGSPVILDAIVRAAMAAGARLAEPGEFTLRAFLNERIDLVQAEAVADLVNAVTPLQARAAFDQLEGTLTGAIGRIDAELFDLSARLEASIDFPEEGYHFVSPDEVEAGLHRIATDIAALLADAARGRIVREGRQVVIAGKPNVGKSTLFNRLLGSERAIVTPQPGTTRDLLTETADLAGVRLCLIDTAGLREAGDAVEREGVARAVGAAAVADLVLVLLDRSRPLDAEDRRLLAGGPGGRLVVVNKCDLPAAWATAQGAPGAVEISLATGDGVTELKQTIAARLLGGDAHRDVPAVTNIRHIALLERAAAAVARARDAVAGHAGGIPEEFLLADLQDARGALEEVTGRRTSEDLLRHIFARFCVGK